MISEADLDDDLCFLADTDVEFAEKKLKMLRQEYRMDLARRRCFLIHEGNIEERKAKAEVDTAVTVAADTYYDLVGEYEQLKAKRATAELRVEVWRSLEASRRQGRI